MDSYTVQVFAFCLKAFHGDNVTKSKITCVILLMENKNVQKGCNHSSYASNVFCLHLNVMFHT